MNTWVIAAMTLGGTVVACMIFAIVWMSLSSHSDRLDIKIADSSGQAQSASNPGIAPDAAQSREPDPGRPLHESQPPNSADESPSNSAEAKARERGGTLCRCGPWEITFVSFETKESVTKALTVGERTVKSKSDGPLALVSVRCRRTRGYNAAEKDLLRKGSKDAVDMMQLFDCDMVLFSGSFLLGWPEREGDQIKLRVCPARTMITDQREATFTESEEVLAAVGDKAFTATVVFDYGVNKPNALLSFKPIPWGEECVWMGLRISAGNLHSIEYGNPKELARKLLPGMLFEDVK